MQVIYEDNHIIAINKAPSEIVQADKTGDEPLSEIVKKYIKEKYDKPGEVFLGTVHRIDRPVSGVLLFARTSKAMERINEMFKKRQIQKTYWAVVKNRPPKESDTLTHYLIKNEKQNKSYASQIPKDGYLECTLKYELLAESDGYFLLKVMPFTGRHHQIRVQLSSIGCIIKGDLKYGFARSNKDASIHLHAREIEFMHPTKNEPLKITAKVPNEPLWKYFEDIIESKKP
jgi:23S rRNA pseudouridine1911/1915/1917 synthase